MNASMWLNFTGFPSQSKLNQNFSDTVIKSASEQKATYEKVATACDSWYAPIFDDVPQEPATTEVAIATGTVEVVPIELKSEEKPAEPATANTAQALTIPPIKIKQNDLLNAVLVGLGVVFVIKILE